MEELDNSLKVRADGTLKERLAEAVLDDALKRELRRLNDEAPSLSYFDLQNRAIH